jgi:hypothetical protein
MSDRDKIEAIITSVETETKKLYSFENQIVGYTIGIEQWRVIRSQLRQIGLNYVTELPEPNVEVRGSVEGL